MENIKNHYNRIFVTKGINKLEIMDYVNKKYPNIKVDVGNGNSGGLLHINENNLYYSERNLCELKVALLPKYKIAYNTITFKNEKFIDEKTAKEFLHKPVLVITTTKDDLNLLNEIKEVSSIKGIKLYKSFFVENLKYLRTNNWEIPYGFTLYKILKYIPKLEEFYENNKELNNVVEDMMSQENYIPNENNKNVNALTIEMAYWIAAGR